MLQRSDMRKFFIVVLDICIGAGGFALGFLDIYLAMALLFIISFFTLVLFLKKRIQTKCSG